MNKENNLDNVKSYLKEISKEYKTGIAKEHAYRPHLKDLIESFDSRLIAVNDPKRVDCGAVDFSVRRDELPIGYIETKDIWVSLDESENSEQIQRYLKALHNFVLTNYLEFRWYVDGELRKTALLAKKFGNSKIEPVAQGSIDAFALLDEFLNQEPEKIINASHLSSRLAYIAREIKEVVIKSFKSNKASQQIRDLRSAISDVLISDICLPEKTGEFADMYAQTIVYGLFAARCNHHGPESFKRLGAAEEIPKTNPFLRRLFGTITSDEIDDEPYIDYVNDLVQILNNTDIDAVLKYFGETGGQGDPVIHFYETFLSLYDPKIREERGVYYTPDSVVSYIVQSVDHVLKNDFELEGGLHDSTMNEYEREKYFTNYKMRPEDEQLPRTVKVECPKVLILDPACGTGTFLYGVINHIRKGFMDGMGAGYWSGYVKRYLLPRILGFEFLMAPYAIAHFKLAMQLKGYDLPEELQNDWCYKFDNDRLGIYLTNTLNEAEHIWKTLYGPFRTITDEANEASVAKKDMPIMVIMGNPPYSGQSVNPSWEIINGTRRHNFIGKLLEDYYFVDNHPLHERQNKWLQDDYVKFVRWAQWRIERTGYGIIAFITNRNYIENPTFRGMRWNLSQAFDDIYILDLHGYFLGRSPDGSKDGNVFNIKKGVAISIFIKKPLSNKKPANVHYAELWGAKDEKYRWLLANNIDTTDWKCFIPESPAYLFKPQDETIKSEYNNEISMKDIFLKTSVGFVTARDKFVIDFNRSSLEERISDFRNLSIADQYFIDAYKLKNTTSWNFLESRKLIAQCADWKQYITICSYRPFDSRYVYYSRLLLDRPVYNIMQHMQIEKNLGLITARSNKSSDMDHFFITSSIMETKCGESTTQSNIFPLYLRTDSEDISNSNNGLQQNIEDSVFRLSGEKGLLINYKYEFIKYVENKLRLKFICEEYGDLETTFGAKDMLFYIYAIFYSSAYRIRYFEFLKDDYPRIPITSNPELFRTLCEYGKNLVTLHLLDFSDHGNTISYPIHGDDKVEVGYPTYEPTNDNIGKIYINNKQYYDGVPSDVWTFRIGGYKVCYNWLKARRNLQLTIDDLRHFEGILIAIDKTLKIMEKIDEAIPEWPIK